MREFRVYWIRTVTMGEESFTPIAYLRSTRLRSVLLNARVPFACVEVRGIPAVVTLHLAPSWTSVWRSLPAWITSEWVQYPTHDESLHVQSFNVLECSAEWRSFGTLLSIRRFHAALANAGSKMAVMSYALSFFSWHCLDLSKYSCRTWYLFCKKTSMHFHQQCYT